MKDGSKTIIIYLKKHDYISHVFYLIITLLRITRGILYKENILDMNDHIYDAHYEHTIP